MAGQLSRIALILALAIGCPVAADTVPLAGYSFDDQMIESGPDTFRVYKNAKGRVSLSSEFPYSGYYSLQLQDAPHNGNFPELQGYFTVRKTGTLHFHFAFMVTDPTQSLNIALAGPEWFRLARNGIGFWLEMQQGFLKHVTDSISKPLFQPTPFVWYRVNLEYRIDQGRYDLLITDGSVTVSDIKDVPNASNQPGSYVTVFSFIGDLEDVSSVNYFIDDIWISADNGNEPPPFAAPGRRKLFIDRWQDRQRVLQAKLRCLPVFGPEDFGLSMDTLSINVGADERLAFLQIVSGKKATTALQEPLAAWSNGIAAWHQGCRLLSAGKPKLALILLEKAAQVFPEAELPTLSRIQALAALKQWTDVDAALAGASWTWGADSKFGVVVGQIGFMRGDLRLLDEWWNGDAEAVPDGEFKAWARDYFGTDYSADKLTAMLDNKRRSPFLQRYVIAEQHFFSLLWRGSHNEAIAYARRLSEHFAAFPKAHALWLERSGDAAFLGGMTDKAGADYRAAAALIKFNPGPLEKLSDLAYLSGDAMQERRYREAVYGSLR